MRTWHQNSIEATAQRVAPDQVEDATPHVEDAVEPVSEPEAEAEPKARPKRRRAPQVEVR